MGDRKEPRPVPTDQVRPQPPPPPPPRRWRVERNINDFGIVRGNQQIAGYIVSKNDARLMAAAPDLLAVLKDVLAVASANAEDLESGETCAACERARAVIAKVEGR